MNVPIFSFLLLSFFGFAADAHYALDHRIPLSGAEGWDCLSIDASSDKLFVSRGNHVDIVDLKNEKVVGTISESIDGAHAIAFVPDLKKGYITSGNSAKVVVFDLASFKVLKEIPAGKKADTIVFDKTTSKIFAFNGDHSATVIDPATDTVLKTIPLDGKPEFAVANDGIIYLNNEDKNELVVIDAKKMVVKTTWPLKGCQSPSGLSADFQSRRLFSVCENEVMVVTDSDTGKQIQSLPIGKKPDGSVFDNGIAYSSNGDGTLTVVQEKNAKNFEVLENVDTQKGARTMTLDTKTHTAYLIAAKYEAADPKSPAARPKIIPGSVEILVVKKIR